ncbi:MAG: glycosyltransferase family 2 protein [Burkholderiaceae bacterium]|nr:MAG: glycosyltransferase family 2 protein [Burkholderiaceae bacterium]
MTPNLVSTIIPVYNRPARLREAVASVLAQDWRPVEILIVDDGSTDEGATLLAAYALAAEHPQAIRVLSQPNGGRAQPANSGASMRKASSFNTSTATTCCCRASSVRRFRVCATTGRRASRTA